MIKLLSKLVGAGRTLGSVAKWLVGAFLKLDWGDRIIYFLLAVVFLGGFMNLRIQGKLDRAKLENIQLSEELTLQRQFVSELQVLVQGQHQANKQLAGRIDSLNLISGNLVADVELWRGVTDQTQAVVLALVQERDSLRRAKVIYVDRCFNAFGREVDCGRRKKPRG